MTKKLSYNFMRIEIQALIMKILHKANKEFKDINYKKMSAQIQYDYGVGPLTVDRITDNLMELELIKISDGIIKTVIKQRLTNGKS